MNNFHPSKIIKLDGQQCGVCWRQLLAAVVKCDQCGGLYHLKCTKMPTHMLIKYFTSRVTYSCGDCVKTKTEEYEDILNFVNDLTGGSDDVSSISPPTTEPVAPNVSDSVLSDPHLLINSMVKSIDELRAEMKCLTMKMNSQNNSENKSSKQKLYSHALKSTDDINQSSQQQAVYIKRKDNGSTSNNNAEISSALKTVPAVSMKNVCDKTIKIVLPNEQAKQRAVAAIEQSEPLNNTYEVSCGKKLKPKLTVTYIPDFIEDSKIIEAVTDKNPEIAELIENTEDMKLLFTQKSAPGFKTAVLSTSPLIRNLIMKTGQIYVHVSRCKVYDRYWVTRCTKCMDYGHKAEKCSNDVPRCGFCSGEHYSKDCNNKNVLNCCHCAKNSSEAKNHSVFDTRCPSFILAKNLIIRRTMHVSEEPCSLSKNVNRQAAQNTGI